MKILSPTSGSPEPKDLVTSGEAPRESGFEGQWDLIAGIPQVWGNQKLPSWGGADKVMCASGPRGKKLSPQKRLDQTYLLVSEGLLWRQGAAVAHLRDKATGSVSSWEYLE